MRVMRSVTYMRLRGKIKEGRIASTRNSDCTDVQDEIQVESELGQKSGAYGISRSVVLKSRSSHRRYLLQPYPPPRKRRRLRTARGSFIFEPWACLRQTAFAVTCSLGHSFAARSQLGQRAFWVSVLFSYRYYGTHGFYVVTMTLDLKSFFSLFGSSFVNNLDLDGTLVYAVVTHSFAASPLISSWYSTTHIFLTRFRLLISFCWLPGTLSAFSDVIKCRAIWMSSLTVSSWIEILHKESW